MQGAWAERSRNVGQPAFSVSPSVHSNPSSKSAGCSPCIRSQSPICSCRLLSKTCGRCLEGALLRFTPMQTTLFGAPAATNGFRNSSFSKNKNLPLHRWVPWIAGFSADFVEDAIRSYLPQKNSDSWVLDPFAGVGTTLVESYLTGLNVVGFEINPYASLATKIKLSAMKISVHDLTRQIAAFERFMERAESGALKRDPRSQAPTGFTGRTE